MVVLMEANMDLTPPNECPGNGQTPIEPENVLEALLPKVSVLGVPADVEVNEKGALVKWEPKVLNPRHREIMRRVLEGATYVDIARDMGITTQSIMLVATSQIFRAELAKMESTADFDVVKRAENLSNEALDTLKVIMRTSKSEARRMQAADGLLDRAGYSKIEKKMIGVVNGEDVIRELNKQRRQAYERMQGGSTNEEIETKAEAETQTT